MTIPHWAFLGNKVVCVGREMRPGEPPVINDRGFTWRPQRGQVYTIEAVDCPNYPICPDLVFLALTECPDGRAQAFPHDAFRPAVSDDNEVETRIYLTKGHDTHAPRKRERVS